jgi:hypothetical protein
MVGHLVEEGRGRTLGYAKFCSNYLGEAAGRCVRGKLYVPVTFGHCDVPRFL